MKNRIRDLGFVSAKELETLPRLILAVHGLDKQGKTHFGLSAPGPIAYINLDEGLEGVIHKHSSAKTIHILDMVLPNVLDGNESSVQGEAQVEWERFNTAYYGALRSEDIRSVVIDTASELRELQLMSHFGKVAQIMPYMYRGPNAEFRKLIRDAFKFDKNVIFLHKMRSVYINDKRTTDYEPTGFKDTGYLAQINAQVWRYDVDDGGDFVLTVKNCRHDPDMAGMSLEGPMCNFSVLASMVMPDVDWGE